MDILIKRNVIYTCEIVNGLIDLSPINGLIHSITLDIPFQGNSKWNIIRKNTRAIILNTVTEQSGNVFYARNLDSNITKRYYSPVHTKMTKDQVKESVFWDKIKETETLFIEIPRMSLTEPVKVECVQFIPYRKNIHFFNVYNEITFEEYIK